MERPIMKTMKNLPTWPTLRGLVLALAVIVLSSYVATATPYATCLTNNAGMISFRLNQAADDVQVVTNGVPIDLGARPVGVTVTNLGIPAGTSYQIVVRK